MQGKGRWGFTLIELLVTLAIASLVVSFALPSFNKFILDKQLKGSAGRFLSSMQLTRSTARDLLNSGVNTARIVAKEGDWSLGWQVINQSDSVVLDYDLPAGITVSVIPEELTNVQFTPRGLPLPSTGQVVLTFCQVNQQIDGIAYTLLPTGQLLRSTISTCGVEDE